MISFTYTCKYKIYLSLMISLAYHWIICNLWFFIHWNEYKFFMFFTWLLYQVMIFWKFQKSQKIFFVKLFYITIMLQNVTLWIVSDSQTILNILNCQKILNSPNIVRNRVPPVFFVKNFTLFQRQTPLSHSQKNSFNKTFQIKIWARITI